MKVVLKSLIAIVSSLLLIQIEVGWYGFFMNLTLVMLLVLLSFHLGYMNE